MAHYTIGSSREGADAYSPLMLLKGLLLQKWYRIDSDQELENQINDRISFKDFMGSAINEGRAMDARLVQSASHPISNEEIKKQREKREISEGKLDKNGNLLKFSRDLDFDWVIKNNKPHYGLKKTRLRGYELRICPCH